jgi:mannosyltransferase OCH1-like enzyme
VSSPIPKVIHRIWLGTQMPAWEAELGERWRAMHPGWRVRTWRDWEIPALRHQLRFDRASSPAAKADIARLELLYRYGGIYVDTDVEPLRPFDDLLGEDVTCFLGREDDRWLGTAVLAAAPGHPFVGILLDALDDAIGRHPDASPNVQSGPKFVTSVYDVSPPAIQASVVVHPPAVFYPYHFSEPARRHGPFPDAFAVHRWSGSWT